jgi:hypothetical protein
MPNTRRSVWLLILLTILVVAAAAAPAADARPKPKPTPPKYTQGIDASHWQGTIDWSRVAGAGKRFVFLKASEGRNYTDPTYASNRAGGTGPARARPASSPAPTTSPDPKRSPATP